MKINLNDSVKVKITDHGRAVHFVHVGTDLPPADKDGFTQLQLHTLMHEFGHTMYPGAKNCIEDCEIHLINKLSSIEQKIDIVFSLEYICTFQNTAAYIYAAKKLLRGES